MEEFRREYLGSGITALVSDEHTFGTDAVLLADFAQIRAKDPNFFASYREERDNVRTQELAYLDAIVAQGADAETLSDAQRSKLDLVNAMETELTVENLVRAKGFTDVIVSIHQGNVNVVVGADTLSDEQVAQILDIVLRETGKSAENVKISTTL